MKQQILVFEEQRRAALTQREIVRSDRGVLIENEYSLVSPGTELALYTGSHIGFTDPEITWARYPLDIGYASVGRVIESERPDLPVGTRVAHYGAHADRIVVDPDTLPCVPVPEHLDPREACFGRFAQIAYSSVAAAVRPAERVLVFGAGIVGILAAQWFRERGAEVWIADPAVSRLERAAGCGLDRTIAKPSGEIGSIRALVEPDTIVEATGAAPVVNDALVLLAPGGQLILLGSIRRPVEINAYKMIHRKVTAVVGAHETVLGDTRAAVLADSLERLAAGGFRVGSLISHEIPPTELPEVYKRIEADPDTWFGVFVKWN